MKVIKRDNTFEKLSFDKILSRIEQLAKDLQISADTITQQVITRIYDEIKTTELDELAAQLCSSMIIDHSDYGILASRIIISNHHKSTSPSFSETIYILYNNKDIHGEKNPLVSENLYRTVMNHKDKLNSYIKYERDYDFDYFGFKTLEKSYLIRVNGKIVERPQHLFMRVALGIHGVDFKDALETYEYMSKQFFTHATPTLYNAGTNRPSLSSCFLLDVHDSVEGMYDLAKECAIISKNAGGIGINIHDIRSKNSIVRGTNGKSNGIIPMLRVFNALSRHIDQAGRRPGSIACFIKDTQILTINEGVKNIQDVKIGDMVVTHKNRVKPVIQVHKNLLEDRKIYKVSILGNNDIYVTGNHKFWSYYTKKIKTKKISEGWNSIEELKTLMDNKETKKQECYVAIPKGTGIETITNNTINVINYKDILLNDKINELREIDDNYIVSVTEYLNTNVRTCLSKPIKKIWNINEEFANIIGIWLGDGYIRKCNNEIRGIGFTVHNKNTKLIDYITNGCKNIFGWNITKDIKKKTNVVQINVNSNMIGKILNNIFGSYFDRKKLPNMVFGWSKNLVNNLIAGLITTDGSINKKKATITLGLSNYTLMTQIYNLCRNNGIKVTSLCKSTNKSGKIHYTTSIEKSTDIISNIYKYYDDDRMERCIEMSKKIENNKDSYLKILSITETDRNDEYVYTLGVDEDHSYTVEGGIIVENCYLEPHHADILQFLDLRKNHGNEEERCRDLFLALWVSDLFMKRVQENGIWSLMDPDECRGLSEVYGEEFEKLYIKYENEGKFRKQIKAQEIWYKIIENQIETGTPYISYKDAVNHKSNQKNLGVIKSSNLCNEINIYTNYRDEIGVCNLASICLPKYISDDGTYNHKELHKIAKILTKNLNKVIDVNYYPLEKAKTSNFRHRPIGLGIQGLSDCFAILKIPFDSEESIKLNKEIFETIYHGALEASMELAKKRKEWYNVSSYNKEFMNNYKPSEELEDPYKIAEKLRMIDEEKQKLPPKYIGAYSSFVGSPTSEGLLQFDLWGITPSSGRYDWDSLKNNIKEHGLRNSLLTAIMPTASTASIMGNNEGAEAFNSMIYKRRVLSGEFIMVNKHLRKDLEALNLWNKELSNQIIMNNGSIQHIPEIPDDIKKIYKIVWEIPQRAVIDQYVDRGSYICQTQSMNLFFDIPDYKRLTSAHFYGWKKGLKTGIYYCRSRTVAKTQLFTIEPEKQIKEEVKEEEDQEGCLSCGA
jgi:ribonucleotide reductase alpha subunit